MSHLHYKVSALIDGELSPNARARALAHARGCDQCRREIAETLEVKQRVTQLAPAEVSYDLLEVVASMSPAAEAPATRVGPALMRRMIVSVGSMSAVVIALAYVVGAPEASQAAAVHPPVKEFAAEFADSAGLAPLADPAVDALSNASASASTTPISFGTFHPGVTPPSARPSRSAAKTASGNQTSAVDFLHEAIVAPDKTTFKGVRVVRSFGSDGAQTFAVDVQHVPGQGTVFDVHDGENASGSALFVAESETAGEGLDGKPFAPLLAAYDLAVEGNETILGRATTVVTASRDNRLTAKFWIDEKTGLLLRRVMYVDGKVVRWCGFTSLTISHDGFMSHLAPEVPAVPTTRLPMDVASALNDKGWAYPVQLAGAYRLSLLRQVDTAGGVMHAEYTDGLSTISVFEERGSLDPSSLGGFRQETFAGNALYVRSGLPMIAVWQAGDTVFTVVTDVPEQIAGTLIARFPHTVAAPSEGVTTRIGTGLSRLVSAVAP